MLLVLFALVSILAMIANYPLCSYATEKEV